MLVALLMIGGGLLTLLLGIIDSYSAPITVPGTVVGHSIGNIDRVPRLTIRLHASGFPPLVSPAVSMGTFRALHDGDQVQANYSPRLRFLYALESKGQQYPLAGVGAVGNPIGSLCLLCIGLLFLPYAALLALWGWRDLRQGRLRTTARIVGLRATERTRDKRAGLTPRLSRSTWYGMALHILRPDTGKIITFSISQETYNRLHTGDTVVVTYSPNVHYVYALERVQAS